MAERWKPHAGPQEMFHRSGAFELLYGGQAGGGKSDSLLIEGMRHIDKRGYAAIYFRRTFPELEQRAIPRSREIFNGLANYNDNKHRWNFPSGATYGFAHLQHEKDKYSYQSAEFSYIAFDELTHFTESQYLYLFSRARNSYGLPVRIRAATNPGGEGHDWVKRRWLPWLGTDEELAEAGWPRAQAGQVLYFKREDDTDILTTSDDPAALSRSFIPASVYDNPTLLRSDPQYIQRLEALPLLERKRLLDGDWSIRPAGNVFKREWFRVADSIPEGLRTVRYWDLAASTKTSADYTVGALVGISADGIWYLLDIVRGRWSWPDARKVIIQTAQLDGNSTPVVIEDVAFQRAAYDDLQRSPEMRNRRVMKQRPDGDKLNRALMWSAKAEGGILFLRAGHWNYEFINEIIAFSGDGKTHDDQVDAVSGAVAALATAKTFDVGFF